MNILSLAAYERARRALRGECEPLLLRCRRRALGTSRSMPNKNPTALGGIFVLAQEEGFEPPCLLGKRFSRLFGYIPNRPE